MSFLFLLTRLELERADVKFCNAVDNVVFGLFACTRCLSPRCSASSGTESRRSHTASARAPARPPARPGPRPPWPVPHGLCRTACARHPVTGARNATAAAAPAGQELLAQASRRPGTSPARPAAHFRCSSPTHSI